MKEAATFFSEVAKGRNRTHRKADMRQEIMRIASRTTSVAANPGVVMQMRPATAASSLLPGNTIVGALLLPLSSREKVRSPVDTTRITLLTPTSFSGSDEVSRRCRLTLRSSLGLPAAACK